MARHRKLESSLAALREGLLTFPEFVEQTCSTWEKLAGYFAGRWQGQSAVCDEDVYQEVLVAVWRAVNRWDPDRGVPIDRFVWYQAGVAATKTMQRALHWSPTRESKTIWSLPLPRKERAVAGQQERVAEAKEALVSALDREGLEREVAVAVLDGRTLDELARDLYADPTSRWRYWLGSLEESKARVLKAARRVGRSVKSA